MQMVHIQLLQDTTFFTNLCPTNPNPVYEQAGSHEE